MSTPELTRAIPEHERAYQSHTRAIPEPYQSHNRLCQSKPEPYHSHTRANQRRTEGCGSSHIALTLILTLTLTQAEKTYANMLADTSADLEREIEEAKQGWVLETAAGAQLQREVEDLKVLHDGVVRELTQARQQAVSAQAERESDAEVAALELEDVEARMVMELERAGQVLEESKEEAGAEVARLRDLLKNEEAKVAQLYP